MAEIMGRWIGAEQITAKLADVLKHGAIPARDVAPEPARGEGLANHDRAAVHEDCTRRLNAAHTVIQRQAIVHSVGWSGSHHARKPMAPLHQTTMAYAGRFGHPGGAGCVDVECAILDRRRNPLSLIERLLRKSF